MSKVQQQSRQRSELRALPGTAGFSETAPVSQNDSKPENNSVQPGSLDTPGVETMEFTVPIGRMIPGANDRPIHVDVYLTRAQSKSLRELLIGLRTVNETCFSHTEKRRLVDSNQDVIRWLLESAARNNPNQPESAR
jgi:hypothetical protein